MKPILFLFGALLFLYSCQKGEEAVIEETSVESFSEIHFKRYDSDLSGYDFTLTEDSSLIVVGHGRNPIARSPFMLKLDSQNEISWLRHFEGDNSYSAIDIVPTMDRGFMILSSINPLGSAKRDNYLIKTSAEGEEWWNKKIGDPALIEVGNSIVQLPNQDFVFVSTIYDEPNLDDLRVSLTRISSYGEVIWTKVIGEGHPHSGRQLEVSLSGDAIILLSESNNLIRVHNMDFEAAIRWEREIEAPGDVYSRHSRFIQTEDQGLLLAFSSDDETNFFVEETDVVAVKLDEEGHEEWTNSYGGNGTELAEGIIQSSDGQFVLLSSTSSHGRGQFDIMLTKINELGEVQWAKAYGSTSSDQGIGLVEKANGDLIVLGNTNHGNDTDAIFDFFLLETNSEGSVQ